MTITMLHGDNTELLPTLAAGSIQCIATSPPYFGLRDYGLPPTDWPAIEYAPMIGVPSIAVPAMSCCLGLEDSPLAYVAHLVHVFRLARPALRADGVAWLNLSDTYAQPSKWGGKSGNKNRPNDRTRYPRRRVKPESGFKDKDLYGIPWRAALALQADGWYVRNQAIWYKPNAMPESVNDRLTNDYEPIYLLAKSRHYMFNQAAIAEPSTGQKGAAASFKRTTKDHVIPNQAAAQHRAERPDTVDTGTRNRRTVWCIPTQQLREDHYAPWPEALAKILILAGSRPGDTVLDPFAGSGTTLRVAERLQRNSIGIDLNGDYLTIQARRTNGVQVELFV